VLLNWVLAAIIISAIVTLGVATTYRHITSSLFHPLVLLNGLFAYYIVIPAAFILATGRFNDRYGYSFVALSDALLVLGSAYLVILIVYYKLGTVFSNTGASTVRGRDLREYATVLSSAVDYQVLTRLGYCGLTVGLLAYGYYIIINGGPMRLLTVTPRTTFQQVPNTARWRWIALSGLFGGTVVTLVGRRARVEAGRLTRRDLGSIVVPVVVTFLAVVSFRARQPILILGLVVLIYLYTTGRFSDRQIAVASASVVLIGVLFTFVEFALLGQVSATALLKGVVHRARLEVFIGIVTHVPSQYPYQFGSTFIGGLPFEWSGLPLTYGQQLSRLFGVETQGVTLSGMLPGELYLNFGIVGVLVGAAIYGAALRVVWVFGEATNSPLMRGIYPVALGMVVLLWPTNVLWATKALVLRLAAPLIAAIVAAILWHRVRARFGPINAVSRE